ncbi:anoctamin-4-like isoform X1 [Rhopilema esculentum]|uniref:anoctamin-4-like isoform X1 n=1 Tax=Rhopilema esculentum TaxID=499914 RepID=UPI0031E3EF02
MANRPIGFEGQDFSQPEQVGYGYPPMNASATYGTGYGAAYPPAVGQPQYPPVEAYPMQTPTPQPYMPDDGYNNQQYRYSGHDQPPTQRQAPRPGSRPASGVDRVSSSQVRPTDRTPTPDRASTRQSRQRDEGSSSIAGSRLLSSDEKPDLREVDDIQADQLFFRDGVKRIDYVLAYQKLPLGDPNRVKGEERRKEFEKNLKRAGLELEYEDNTASSDGMTYFVKVHAPMASLYKGAELMHMKMPIKKNDLIAETFADEVYKKICCCKNPFALASDDIPEEENYFTCPFHRSKMEEFHGHASPDFFTNAQRSIIVHRYLMKCKYGIDKLHLGVNRMVSKGHYTAAYPLHEGNHKFEHSLLTHKPTNDRQLLYYHWARFTSICKEQPLDLIRKYFGEKIGLYFSWLGFYTLMLIPAAILGVISIIYGMATMNDFATVKDICGANNTVFLMCPRCDVSKCPVWNLSDSCKYSMVAYVLDNPFTVVFAIFMSFWATCFLEFWKRKQAEISYDWDLIGFEDEEEQPRAEYENKLLAKGERYRRTNPITDTEEPFIRGREKTPKFVCSFFTVIFMVSLVVAAMLGVIMYRVAVTITLAKSQDFDISWISLFASFTAATVNLICIMILNKLYERIAFYLTKWELPRTQTNFDDAYTFKMYLFQFVNFYGSLFYIAFFKLDPGRPGQYNKIFGFRREECNPAGCLFELGVQLFVIMVGKQVFNTCIEVVIPKLKNWWRKRKTLTDDEIANIARWDRDYKLTEVSQQGLFDEYLEMVIQFGFITIFVAAFPLGPFFALINNMIEIRVDAYKFVVLYRRPLAQKVQDIGIWYPILESVVKLSVVINAFVIAFVSEFVQRLYYRFAVQANGTLEGFIADSLSCFDMRDFPLEERPVMNLTNRMGQCELGNPYCRYRGYYESPYMNFNGTTVRNPHAYHLKTEHWHIVAGKLFFVVVFEHLVFFLTGLLAWVIPDVPKHLDNQVKKEAFLAKKALISEDIVSTQSEMDML